MSHMKDKAIDQMNNMFFEVYIFQANGPDDCEWEIYSQHTALSEATKQMASLENRGYSTKLFDPWVGSYYDQHGKEL